MLLREKKLPFLRDEIMLVPRSGVKKSQPSNNGRRRLFAREFFRAFRAPRSQGRRLPLLSGGDSQMSRTTMHDEKSKTGRGEIRQSLGDEGESVGRSVKREPLGREKLIPSALLSARTCSFPRNSRRVLTFILRGLVTHGLAHSRPSHGHPPRRDERFPDPIVGTLAEPLPALVHATRETRLLLFSVTSPFKNGTNIRSNMALIFLFSFVFFFFCFFFSFISYACVHSRVCEYATTRCAGNWIADRNE